MSKYMAHSILADIAARRPFRTDKYSGRTRPEGHYGVSHVRYGAPVFLWIPQWGWYEHTVHRSLRSGEVTLANTEQPRLSHLTQQEIEQALSDWHSVFDREGMLALDRNGAEFLLQHVKRRITT